VGLKLAYDDLEDAYQKYDNDHIEQLSIEDLAVLSIQGREKGLIDNDEQSEIIEELADRTEEDIYIVGSSNDPDT